MLKIYIKCIFYILIFIVPAASIILYSFLVTVIAYDTVFYIYLYSSIYILYILGCSINNVVYQIKHVFC